MIESHDVGARAGISLIVLELPSRRAFSSRMSKGGLFEGGLLSL